jgi:plasmid stabilization system protein ParE
MTAGGSYDAGFAARFETAREAFERGELERAASLIAADEGRPGAIWLRANIAAARGELDGARTLAETLAANPRIGEEAQAQARLLLASVLDRLGEPASAFAEASRAKRVQRRLFAARAAGREDEVRKLVRLTAWYAASAPWPAAPAPRARADDPATHVFLVGFPRSGTTLLEQALAAHPHVVTLEEAPTLADHYQAFLADDAGPARLRGLDEPAAARWRGAYWRTVRDHGVEPRGKVFVDKAPAGTLYLPLVARLFPEARILFVIRDPRDVVLSCFTNLFAMNALTYSFTDLGETAACYGACMALAEVYRTRLPLAWRDVRHEALVADFATELAAIADFIGVVFDPAMAAVGRAGRRVRTPSGPQLRAGLNRRGVEHWRAYAEELAPVSAKLGPWIERFRYPAD